MDARISNSQSITPSSPSLNLPTRASKKFECSYCSKSLSSRQNLREHEFTHTGELPYVCKSPGCGLRFRQGSVLSAHRRIHNVIEKYTNPDTCNWIKVITI